MARRPESVLWIVADAATSFCCGSRPSGYKSSAWTEVTPWNSEKSFWTRYEGVLYVLQELPFEQLLQESKCYRSMDHIWQESAPISPQPSIYLKISVWSIVFGQQSWRSTFRASVLWVWKRSGVLKAGTPVIVKGNHRGWISVRTGGQPVIVKHDHARGPAPILCVHKEGSIRCQLHYIAVPLHTRHKSCLCYCSLNMKLCHSWNKATEVDLIHTEILQGILWLKLKHRRCTEMRDGWPSGCPILHLLWRHTLKQRLGGPPPYRGCRSHASYWTCMTELYMPYSSWNLVTGYHSAERKTESCKFIYSMLQRTTALYSFSWAMQFRCRMLGR